MISRIITLSLVLITSTSFAEGEQSTVKEPVSPQSAGSVQMESLYPGQVYTGWKTACADNGWSQFQPYNKTSGKWIGYQGFSALSSCKKAKTNSLNNAICSVNQSGSVQPHDLRRGRPGSTGVGKTNSGFSSIDECATATINSRYKVVCNELPNGDVGAYYIPGDFPLGYYSDRGFSNLDKCTKATINITTYWDYSLARRVHLMCTFEGKNIFGDNLYTVRRVENNAIYSSYTWDDIDDCLSDLVNGNISAPSQLALEATTEKE